MARSFFWSMPWRRQRDVRPATRLIDLVDDGEGRLGLTHERHEVDDGREGAFLRLSAIAHPAPSRTPPDWCRLVRRCMSSPSRKETMILIPHLA